jgi:hypothetical protein
MDKQFIVVCYNGFGPSHIYLFSKKTLDLYWQKTIVVGLDNFAYDQGILLLYVLKHSESEEFGLIELYDVTSGTCFREIRTEVKHSDSSLDCLVGFNSKFMVIAKFGCLNNQMDVYDLAAVKNPIADRIWLCTLVVETGFCQLMVSETEIFYANYSQMHRLDFSTLENLGDEEKSIFALPKTQAE